MSEAMTNDIFVPVDLVELQNRLQARDFGYSPAATDGSGRRPSIETLLHGLMPQKFVLHIHAVNSLSLLVHKQPEKMFERLMPDPLRWALADYHMPGADLCAAIMNIGRLEDLDVLLLANHGVVFAADHADDLTSIIDAFLKATDRQAVADLSDCTDRSLPLLPAAIDGLYHWATRPAFQNLAQNPKLFNRVRNHWVLYPDHAVFLGGEAVCVDPDALPEKAARLALRSNRNMFSWKEQACWSSAPCARQRLNSCSAMQMSSAASKRMPN